MRRTPWGADDWWEISDVREMHRNGTPVKAFEFRGDVTGSMSPVLIISDGWDVFVAADAYPANWRDLPEAELFRALLVPPLESSSDSWW
jgi:hypothetical protein